MKRCKVDVSYPELEEIEDILKKHYFISNDLENIRKGDLNYAKREKSLLICLFHILSNIRFALLLFVEHKYPLLYTYLGNALHVLGIGCKGYFAAIIAGVIMDIGMRLVFFWKEYKNQLDFITDFTLMMPKNQQKSTDSEVTASNHLESIPVTEKKFHRNLQLILFCVKQSVRFISNSSYILFTSITIYSAVINDNPINGLFYVIWLPVGFLVSYHAASDCIIPLGVWLISVQYIQMRLDQFFDHVKSCMTSRLITHGTIDSLISDYISICRKVFRYNLSSSLILLAYHYFAEYLVCILLYVAFVADLKFTYVRMIFVAIAFQIVIFGYLITVNASLVYYKAKSPYQLLNSLQVDLISTSTSLCRQKRRVSCAQSDPLLMSVYFPFAHYSCYD